MWAYPYLNWAALVAFVLLAILMLSDASARVQLISAAVMFAILFVASLVNSKARGLSPWEKAPLPEHV